MRVEVGSRHTRMLLMAAVLAMLSVPASALGYCRLTTTMAVAGTVCSSTGTPLYWPRQCINYAVSPRANTAGPAFEDIRSVVDESFATWTGAQCGGATAPAATHALGMSLEQTDALSMCETPQYNDHAANVNSIIFVSDWADRDLPPEAFGLTLVWHRSRSGVIVDADMQLNEGLGPFAICGARCPRGSVDLQNIVTHEAGHFLGLGHSDQTNACMYGKATVGETSKRYLSHDDMEGICAIYGDRSEPSCSDADYTPDNGQGAQCTISSDSSSGCSVLGPSRRNTLASALLALGCCALIVRRRRRR